MNIPVSCAGNTVRSANARSNVSDVDVILIDTIGKPEGFSRIMKCVIFLTQPVIARCVSCLERHWKIERHARDNAAI